MPSQILNSDGSNSYLRTHLGNDRHGRSSDITGSHTENLKVPFVTHFDVVYCTFDLISWKKFVVIVAMTATFVKLCPQLCCRFFFRISRQNQSSVTMNEREKKFFISHITTAAPITIHMGPVEQFCPSRTQIQTCGHGITVTMRALLMDVSKFHYRDSKSDARKKYDLVIATSSKPRCGKSNKKLEVTLIISVTYSPSYFWES